MSAQHESDRQHTNAPVVQPANQPPTSPVVEDVSVRILFDDRTIDCAGCGDSIDRKTRYKHLVVREQDGTIEEYSICSEDCRGRCC